MDGVESTHFQGFMLFLLAKINFKLSTTSLEKKQGVDMRCETIKHLKGSKN